MPEEKTLEINFVQTLVKAINLAMEAHDFCPDNIDVKFFHDNNGTERSEVLSVKVNETSVTLDLFRQCLRPLYGQLEVVDRKW
jgi:hypothetical protein